MKLRSIINTTLLATTINACATQPPPEFIDPPREETLADSLYAEYHLDEFPGVVLEISREEKPGILAEVNRSQDTLTIYLPEVIDEVLNEEQTVQETFDNILSHEREHFKDMQLAKEIGSTLYEELFEQKALNFEASLQQKAMNPFFSDLIDIGIRNYLNEEPIQVKEHLLRRAISEGIAEHYEIPHPNLPIIWQPETIHDMNSYKRLTYFIYKNGHAIVHPILEKHGREGIKKLLTTPPTAKDYTDLQGYQTRTLEELANRYTLKDFVLDVRTPTPFLKVHPDTTLVAKKTLAQATKELAALTITQEEEDMWMYIPATNEWYDIGYQDTTATLPEGVVKNSHFNPLTMKRRTTEEDLMLCHIHPAYPHTLDEGLWNNRHYLRALPSHIDFKTQTKLNRLYDTYKNITGCLVTQFGTFTYAPTTPEQRAEYHEHDITFLLAQVEEQAIQTHTLLPGRIASIYKQPFFREPLERRARAITTALYEATGNQPTKEEKTEIFALSAGITALTYAEMADDYLTLEFTPHTPETLQYLVQLKTREEP